MLIKELDREETPPFQVSQHLNKNYEGLKNNADKIRDMLDI